MAVTSKDKNSLMMNEDIKKKSLGVLWVSIFLLEKGGLKESFRVPGKEE